MAVDVEAGARLFEELMRFKPDGLTANGWAVKAGVSRAIWADLRRHGNPSRRTLEKLLAAVGSSLAEFEALRVDHRPDRAAGGLADPGRSWRGKPLPPVPLLDMIVAGEWGDPGSRIPVQWIERSRAIGTIERPNALAADGDAYAVSNAAESMWPRFRAGRRLLVAPAAAIAVGDDVLVELAGGGVLIGELVGRPAKRVRLRQFNPDCIFGIGTSEIAAIHKVAGEAI